MYNQNSSVANPKQKVISTVNRKIENKYVWNYRNISDQATIHRTS